MSASNFDGHFWSPDMFVPDYWGTATDIIAPSTPGDDCVAVLPYGSRGVGPDPEGRDYPFVQPSADVRGVLAHVWLTHDGEGLSLVTPPLRVAWMWGFDKAVNCGDVLADIPAEGGDPSPTHEVDILILDAADRVIFDSTTASTFLSSPYADRLRVYQWRTAGASLVVAQHTAVSREADARQLTPTIRPDDGRLDEWCSDLVPRRALVLGIAGRPGEISGKGGALVGGYNTTIAVRPRPAGLRSITEVRIDVVPGTGEGRAPGCEDPEVVGLRSINGVFAVNGNVNLAGLDCYYVRQPFADDLPVPATLKVGNDCGPCCPCDEFEAVQADILARWAVFEGIATSAEAVVASFEDAIARWDEQRTCRALRAVRLNILPFGRYVEVASSVCNTSTTCLYGVTLTVEVDSAAAGSIDPATGVVTDGRGNTTLADPPLGGASGSASWAVVPPQSAVSLRFRFIVGGTDPAEVVVTASATSEDGDIPTPVTKTVTVH